MQKAKDFVKAIIETWMETSVDVAINFAHENVVDTLFTEASELEKKRNISPTNVMAMINILKEQHIKWLSVCRNTKTQSEGNIELDEYFFIRRIRENMPGIMQHITKTDYFNI